jgi:hypothetical protein
MKAIKVSALLSPIFTTSQISRIPLKIRDKDLLLAEVSDIDAYIQECRQVQHHHKVAGEHRWTDWEKGWSGEGVYYSKDEYNNTPYYFYRNTHLRVNNKVYEDISRFSELNLLRALQSIIVCETAEAIKASVIVEYGCGTGSNIQFLKELMPNVDFYGTDWVKSAIEKLISNQILDEYHAFIVNYFDASSFWAPKDKFIAFTNASLEQSGSNFREFIDYLVDNEHCIGGIHIEPIRELLDLTLPLNQQSYEYAQKRGYLEGFYKYLQSLNIEIIQAKDYGVGSKYISGYQVITWRKNESQQNQKKNC